MERTRINKIPTAILTSDWHLREDTPICRTDDYWSAQWKKVDFISALQKKYNCPVIHAGDLFDKWKPSPYLLSTTILHIPDCFYTILGQHDLPQHSLELIKKCGTYTLSKANKLHILPWCHWGQDPKDCKDFEGSINIGGPKVLVWHKMNYQGKKPWPGCIDPMAVSLLRKYPQFDLIVTGDNHQSFSEEYKGRILVNPGSLMRMDADQVDHRPCVYLWFAEDNSIQQVFIPIIPNVITREHIEQAEQRDMRISAFVSKLNDDYKTELSFEENLEQFFKANNIKESVKEIIYKSTENGI
jgi:DNA repair exonuclease SbcCD nuclease subunit